MGWGGDLEEGWRGREKENEGKLEEMALVKVSSG